MQKLATLASLRDLLAKIPNKFGLISYLHTNLWEILELTLRIRNVCVDSNAT